MNYKKVKNLSVGIYTRRGDSDTIVPHISRGIILSGVLSGTCGYDSVPVLVDAPPGVGEPEIDYDPSNDQRLDRFDAVELGIDAIDKATPESLPYNRKDPGVEKNE